MLLRSDWSVHLPHHLGTPSVGRRDSSTNHGAQDSKLCPITQEVVRRGRSSPSSNCHKPEVVCVCVFVRERECERERASKTECRLWFHEALRDDGRCCLYCPGGFKVFAFCSSAPAPGETPSAGSGSIITPHHTVNCQPSSNSEPLGALPTTHHAQPNISESVRK